MGAEPAAAPAAETEVVATTPEVAGTCGSTFQCIVSHLEQWFTVHFLSLD